MTIDAAIAFVLGQLQGTGGSERRLDGRRHDTGAGEMQEAARIAL